MVVGKIAGWCWDFTRKTPRAANDQFQPHTTFLVGVTAVVTHYLKGFFGHMLRDGGDELFGRTYPEVLSVPAVGHFALNMGNAADQ
jgi:hypothetical protein